MTPTTPSSALLTDLYQLTMLQAYFQHGLQAMAAFEFFVRKLPKTRNFLIAAGLEQLLEFLESVRLTEPELEWLRGTGKFAPPFVDWLANLRFTGDVYAMPEGTPFFPDEPIVRVVAPIAEAQFVESRLINLLQFQTLIASKAARAVLIAPGKQLVDFGMRRAHGAEAALLAARASYLAGFHATSNVQAGMMWGIPTAGTMAHSFIQAHDDEARAFEDFATANPQSVVLLIDTYDTEAAAEKVVKLAPRLRERGITIQGVRIDSGDLAEHAHRVRKILDDGGLQGVTIFASGGLDEYAVAELIDKQAPIDGFGIGTQLDVSGDAPCLDCAYKLQEYDGRPRRKKSEGKATWPGRKQVYRRYDERGVMLEDHLTLENDPVEGEPLLVPAMQQGRRITPPFALTELRERAVQNYQRLPPGLMSLDQARSYPVRIAESVRHLAEQLDRESR